MEKSELKAILYAEKKLYFNDKADFKKMKRSRHKRFYIYKYLYYFRWCQYYRSLRQNSQIPHYYRYISKYKFRHYDRMKNIYSYKSGVEIGLDSNIGKCCNIWHSGVVVNGNIGDNCIFHGNNTVGNKGSGKENLRPIIGDNVDFGVGSVVIGDIIIADDCIIGAGAVATKSFVEKGSLIVGVPGETSEKIKKIKNIRN